MKTQQQSKQQELDPFRFDDNAEGFTYVRRAPSLKQLLIGFVLWYVHTISSPFVYVYNFFYKNLIERYGKPPLEFIWRNKYNFMKYAFVIGVYVVCTLFTASVMYFIIRSCFTVKEHTTVPLYFDFNNQIPTAEVAVAYGSIVAYQSYSVSVNMELPESPRNVDVGMFMVNVRVYSDDDDQKHLLLDVARPCMLRYKTWVMKLIHTVVFAFPSIIGIYEEKQMLEIVMTDEFMTNRKFTNARVVVSVSNHDIQVYSSEVNFKATLSWISYWFQRWPITSYIVGVFILSFFSGTLILIAGAALYVYLKHKFSSSSSLSSSSSTYTYHSKSEKTTDSAASTPSHSPFATQRPFFASSSQEISSSPAIPHYKKLRFSSDGGSDSPPIVQTFEFLRHEEDNDVDDDSHNQQHSNHHRSKSALASARIIKRHHVRKPKSARDDDTSSSGGNSSDMDNPAAPIDDIDYLDVISEEDEYDDEDEDALQQGNAFLRRSEGIVCDPKLRHRFRSSSISR